MEELKIDKQHERLARMIGYLVLGDVEIERVLPMTGQYIHTINLPISREVTFGKPKDPPIYSTVDSEAIDLNRIALPIFLGGGLFSMGYGPKTKTLILHGKRTDEAKRLRNDLMKAHDDIAKLGRTLANVYGVREITDALPQINEICHSIIEALARPI